jgi:hypothetical protein
MMTKRNVPKPLLCCVYLIGCLGSLGISVHGFVLWREAGYQIASWFDGGTRDHGAFHLLFIGIVLFAYCLFGLYSTTPSVDKAKHDDE